MLCACSSTGPDEHEGPRAELEENRERWEERGFADYDLTLERLCFCHPELLRPVLVRVREDRIVSVIFAETGEPVAAEFAPLFPDVEGLFEIIEDAIERGADSLEVDYDPVLGHPVRIAIDYDFNVADEELFFNVISLQPASAS